MTINAFDSDSRMLVGGRLVEARGGKNFPVINPATEEVVGSVTDAAADDMDAAIAAARGAFDDGKWATDRELRKRALTQLRDAIAGDLDDWRGELVAETGCPVALTYGPQLDGP